MPRGVSTGPPCRDCGRLLRTRMPADGWCGRCRKYHRCPCCFELHEERRAGHCLACQDLAGRGGPGCGGHGGGPAPPGHEERVARYRERAALGLPLFA